MSYSVEVDFSVVRMTFLIVFDGDRVRVSLPLMQSVHSGNASPGSVKWHWALCSCSVTLKAHWQSLCWMSSK